MTKKRFATNGYKIYDTFHDGECLLISETEEIVIKMNNLDTKARERGKHLSKLQKENDQLKQENEELKKERDYYMRKHILKEWIEMTGGKK